MTQQYKQKREQGFTIVEVLIVLAVAALILLIVFLAVPALQRNSRNNSTRNEASDILAAANDFEANNQGLLPNNVTCTNGQVSVTGASGTPSETRVRGGTACAVSASPPADTGTINIGFGYKCDPANPGTPIKAPRSFAALYLVETGGNSTAPNCLES